MVRLRGCVDLCLSAKEDWIVTANEQSNSVSLLRTSDGAVLDEISCGVRPSAIERYGDNGSFLVSCRHSGEVCCVHIEEDHLSKPFTIPVAGEPLGIAIDVTRQRAFVGLVATGEIAEIDLLIRQVVRRIAVGNWPRYLALSPDGMRLAVGCSGESKVVIVDAHLGEVLYGETLSGGINLGHFRISADSRYVYFPWMVYRTNPINPRNIRLGWVLASRIGRVRLDGPAFREAISLDVPGLAVADPHGISLSGNGERLVVAASGTHELLVYKLPELPFIGVGGPGDLIDPKLARNRDVFDRVELGGRPMAVRVSADGDVAWVANDLRQAVQRVDLVSRRLMDEFKLGPAPEPTMVDRGREIFFDGRRSLDQWYSCHSCHYEGGTNSKAMDTLNDGSEGTLKTVLPLMHLAETKPWTWHGWQLDLADAMQRSFTGTMQGKRATDDDVQAIIAYLESLRTPPNPFVMPETQEAVARGAQIFKSEAAGCANCHHGPRYSDGGVHDVGLGNKNDRYQGYNTPSLTDTYRKVRWLHDGRAKSLEDLLSGPHSPEKVSQERPLTPEEIADLVTYLRTL